MRSGFDIIVGLFPYFFLLVSMLQECRMPLEWKWMRQACSIVSVCLSRNEQT